MKIKTTLSGRLEKGEILLSSKQRRQSEGEHAENHHGHNDDYNNAETFFVAGEVHSYYQLRILH